MKKNNKRYTCRYSWLLLGLSIVGLTPFIFSSPALSATLRVEISPGTLYTEDPDGMEQGAMLSIFGGGSGRIAFTVTPADTSVTVTFVGDNPFGQAYYRLHKKIVGTTQINVRSPQGDTGSNTLIVVAGKKPGGPTPLRQMQFSYSSDRHVGEPFNFNVIEGYPPYTLTSSTSGVTIKDNGDGHYQVTSPNASISLTARDSRNQSGSITIALQAAQATVPNVMGKTEAEARQILQGAGFKVKVTASISTPFQGTTLSPAALANLGKVVTQGPAGGAKVAVGAEVTIGIMTSPDYKVPDVRGLKEDAAVQKINNDIGYVVSVQEQFEKVTDQARDKTVIRTIPAPGSPFKMGDSITLVLGRFGNLIPNVQGMTEQAARDVLSKVPGIEKIITSAFRTPGDATQNQNLTGKVFKTSPQANDVLQPYEKTVTLYLYKYETPGPAATAQMPDLYHLSIDQATQKLNSLGITNITVMKDSIFYTSDPTMAGKVGSQSPGANAPITDVKTVKVLLYPLLLKGEDVKVPNVVMISGDSAVSMIKALGLTPKVEYYKETNKELWDKVITQDPRPYTVVKKGTTVTIREAQAALKVPVLIGLTLTEALSTLKSMGLTSIIKDQITGVRDQDGKVLAEDPKVGTTLDPGAGVTITVGRYRPTVPNLIGLSETEARKALDDRGLKIAMGGTKDTNLDSLNGKVADQSPGYPSQGKVGDTITVFLGKIIIVVPNVLGKTEKEAQDVLGKAQIKTAPCKYVKALNPTDAGKVMAQDLPPGLPYRGTLMLLTIGK